MGKGVVSSFGMFRAGPGQQKLVASDEVKLSCQIKHNIPLPPKLELAGG